MLQRLARLRVRGQHDDLGEGRIRQFRRHREEEAGSALTDIARDDLGLGLVVQPVFELLDRGGRRLDAGAFRQANLHQHFGAVGCREELLFDGAHADDGKREGDADDAAGYELVAHGKGDEPSQAPIVRCVVDRVVTAFDRLDRGQHLDAEIGREDHRDDPGDDEGEPHDPEDVAGVFAGRRAREAHRQEPGDRHECSGQHRRRGVAPRIGRRLDAVHALFHFHHHHLDGDDGVVHEKTERQDEGAERDAVEEPAGFQHDEEHDGERQRDGSRHDDADAPAEAEQAHQQHHAERHRELHHEFVDRRGDVDGLVGHLVERHPERQCLCDGRRPVLQRLAERETIPALLHDRREHDGGLTLTSDEVGGRILVAAADLGDVGELQRPPRSDDRRVGDRLNAVISAVDPDEDPRPPGVDRACRRDGVLPLQGGDDVLCRHAEGCQLGIGKLDEYLFGTFTEDVDLLDAGHVQEVLADHLGLPAPAHASACPWP